MSVLHRYVKDQILTNFHIISTYFFDVILLAEKSKLFPRTFFDVISLAEKSSLFSQTFLMRFRLSKNPRSFHVLFLCHFDGHRRFFDALFSM